MRTAPPRRRQPGPPASGRENRRSVEASSRRQKQRRLDAGGCRPSHILPPRFLTCSVEEQEREIWSAQPERLLLAVAIPRLSEFGSGRPGSLNLTFALARARLEPFAG